MNCLRTTDDLQRLGTILFVAAHPDDESFLAGGILAAAVANGQTVIVYTATRGEAGVQNERKWPSATLGGQRSEELEAGLRELGVETSYVFDFADGGLADIPPAKALDTLWPVLAKHQPDTILTFGADGLTGHPDHTAVSGWVDRAAHVTDKHAHIYHAVVSPYDYEHYLKQLSEKINLFFNIDQPPLCPTSDCAIAFSLPDAVLSQKIRALQAMPSQTEKMFQVISKQAICKAFGRECFVRAKAP